MHFHYGPVPPSLDFEPDSRWHALREPSLWLLQLVALPIGILAAALIGVLWLTLTPLSPFSFDPLPWVLILSLVGLAGAHELVHAAMHPMTGRSSRSVIGFWPSRLIFYAHYDGELSRNRFLIILIMPFLVLSVLPLGIAAMTQTTSIWMAFLSTLNALLACVDLFGSGMVLFQIPTMAVVRNQGWKTYWSAKDVEKPAGPELNSKPEGPSTHILKPLGRDSDL